MTVDTESAVRRGRHRDHRFEQLPGRATVVQTSIRRVAVEGTVAGTLFGLFALASADGYAASYRTPVQRAVFARSLHDNVGLSAILGHPWQLDTVAGFTAWRGLGVLSLVAAVWGLFLATRISRGEEEAGRWELLLSGSTTVSRATGQTLLLLATAWSCLWSTTALLALLSAHVTKLDVSDRSAVFYATGATASAAVFMSLGLLAAQLTARRRVASMMCGAVLGVSVVVRVVANASSGLRWTTWLSPLGWIEQSKAMTGSRPFVFVPVIATVVFASAIAWRISAARDLGAGAIASEEHAAPRLRMLGSPLGLAARTVRSTAIGWLLGVAGYGLLFGGVAKSAADATSASEQMRTMLARLGARGGGAAAYLGVTFLIIATLLLLIVAGQVVATRDEESSARLDNLFTRPIGRYRWLSGRLAVALVLLVSCGIVAGLAEWCGATATHASVGLGRLVVAGIAVTAPAVALLGIGTLTHAVAPRWTGTVVYAAVAWSFLVDLVGSLFRGPHWLLDTSLTYHVALAPAVDPDWTSTAVLALLGVAAAVVGAAWFARRDLVGS